MTDYLTFTQKIIQDIKTQEATLPLLDETCASRFFFHPQPTSTVFLFFHGFTAVPYQFEPLGKFLYEAGYNVLIPLQPGHGIAGNWNENNPPPLPENLETYTEFCNHWLEIAQIIGEKIIIGGLSTGGILAANMALEYSEKIEKVLLFAPYFGGTNEAVDWFVKLANIYFKWFQTEGQKSFGYEGFEMPKLRVLLNLAEEILNRTKKEPTAPIFLISSAADKAVDPKEQEKLFKNSLKFQPKSWFYTFDKSLNIPHTMMTKEEGNNYLELLISITQAYIENDLNWEELQQLRWRIAQGENFETAINHLNLTQRVYPSLSVMLPKLGE
ncbi:MAG TPA: alpha/beta fold hydrolase [Halomicronema sp.]